MLNEIVFSLMVTLNVSRLNAILPHSCPRLVAIR